MEDSREGKFLDLNSTWLGELKGSPLESVYAMSTSVQSALCIVVPEHLTSWIQRCRSQHDRAFERWPPHIKYVSPIFPIRPSSALVGTQNHPVD